MSGEDRNDLNPGIEQPDLAGDAVAVADAPHADAEDLAAELGESANLDLLMDVSMKVTVELGRARLKFRDVLNLSTGSVVELSKLTSEPVDIMVNGALLATGEVVVVDDHFAVRITKLLNRVERLKRVV
jgi:flagellar motor switch protein FliN/FliY